MKKSIYNVTYLPMKNNRQSLIALPMEKAKPATFMCGGLRTPYLVIYSGKDSFENAL